MRAAVRGGVRGRVPSARVGESESESKTRHSTHPYQTNSLPNRVEARARTRLDAQTSPYRTNISYNYSNGISIITPHNHTNFKPLRPTLTLRHKIIATRLLYQRYIHPIHFLHTSELRIVSINLKTLSEEQELTILTTKNHIAPINLNSDNPATLHNTTAK